MLSEGLETNERYSPESVLSVVRAVAPIGLDPCTTAENPTAARVYYTREQDGLQTPWRLPIWGELIYVNPPYSRGELERWADKINRELASAPPELEVIALTPCDLGTAWSKKMFSTAAAIAGWRGRVAFVRPSGEYETGAKQPSLFWYWGERAARFYRVFEPHANVTILGGSR